MEWREVGTEALKYSITGFTGFGLGAVFGSLAGKSAVDSGIVFAVSFIASRALNALVRKLALKNDLQLSTYHIVKRLADLALKIATATTLFAVGVLSSTGLIVMGSVSLAFCAIDIGLGIYLRYSEQDDLLDDVVVDKSTPWYIKHAFA